MGALVWPGVAATGAPLLLDQPGAAVLDAAGARLPWLWGNVVGPSTGTMIEGRAVASVSSSHVGRRVWNTGDVVGVASSQNPYS
jgi:hypothetical protein